MVVDQKISLLLDETNNIWKKRIEEGKYYES